MPHRDAIAEGLEALDRATRRRMPGSYQLQAAIAACHATAATPGDTDWAQIAELYDRLMTLHPGPVIALNRAVAVAMSDGPRAGLNLVDQLDTDGLVTGYHPPGPRHQGGPASAGPATRAGPLRRLGRHREAAQAYRRALDPVTSDADRRFLTRRLDELPRPARVSGSRRRLEGVWVLHVDMDQFIAAVEMLRHPELAGLPVVVGGAGDPSQRGVVATASYAAREFGVHSGIPLRTALKRCPQAVFLPADNSAYEEASASVQRVLRSFDVIVEVIGWDECFLGADTDDPESLAREIQAAVLEQTALHCSIGIGDNTLRAKLATEFGKPAGVYRLTAENWAEVMFDRPTRALWGVGAKTSQKLADLGFLLVRDLAAADPEALAREFGPATGPWLVQLAKGLGRRTVKGEPWVPRSRSRETTFQQDLTEWDDVRAEVASLARRVCADVAADGRPGARVAVKVRFAPFFTSTHSARLASPTLDPALVESAALDVLERFERRRPVRLVGVRLEFAPP